MAREKAEKVWIGGGAVAALLVAGGVWTFAVSPELSNADSLRSQASDTEVQNLTLEGQVGKLQQSYNHIGDVRKALAAARAALPGDSGLAALSQQLGAQARAAHVKLTQVDAGIPAPMTQSAAATATTAAAPAPTPTSTAPAGTTPVAPSGVYTIPVTVIVSGTPAAEMAFLHLVQTRGSRAALVSSVQMQNQTQDLAGSTGGPSTVTIQMSVFVAPQAAPVTTAAPSPTPAP